jgi:hypothetical protein
MMAKQSAAARYDAGNLAAARIVLADVDLYGGEGAGLVIWARLVLEWRAEAAV